MAAKTSAVGAIIFFVGLIMVIGSFSTMGDLSYADQKFKQKYWSILVTAMFGWLFLIIGAVIFFAGFKKVKPVKVMQSVIKKKFNYTYDPIAKLLYIHTYNPAEHDQPEPNYKTLTIDQNTNLDFDKDNHILGVKILLNDKILEIEEIKNFINFYKY